MMVPSKSLFSAALAFAFAGAVASGQSQLPVKHVNGPIRHATYDLATGKVTKQPGNKAGVTCFVNTDTSYFFSLPGSNGGIDEWLSWGVKACGASGVVGGFSFGYASNALTTTQGGTGAAMTLVFQAGATGFGSFGSDVASFSFSGLPASPAGFPCAGCGAYGWLVGVSLVGGFEFCLPDGPFGFSYIFDQGPPASGGTGGTGPLLCYAGNGAGGPDANGQVDAFDWYSPPPPSTAGYLGAFFFGGPPFDFSSWYLTISEGVCAGPAQAAGCGVGGVVHASTTLSLGCGNSFTMTLTHPTKFLGVFAVSLGPPTVGSVCLPFAGGLVEVPVGAPLGGLVLTAVPFVAGVSTLVGAVPTDLTLCGVGVLSQGAGVPGLTLSNSIRNVVGL